MTGDGYDPNNSVPARSLAKMGFRNASSYPIGSQAWFGAKERDNELAAQQISSSADGSGFDGLVTIITKVIPSVQYYPLTTIFAAINFLDSQSEIAPQFGYPSYHHDSGVLLANIGAFILAGVIEAYLALSRPVSELYQGTRIVMTSLLPIVLIGSWIGFRWQSSVLHPIALVRGMALFPPMWVAACCSVAIYVALRRKSASRTMT